MMMMKKAQYLINLHKGWHLVNCISPMQIHTRVCLISYLIPALFLLFPAERLNNFVIGVTDNDPRIMKPTPESLDLCATNTQAIGRGASKAFECEASGQYVVVQLKGRNYLTLCEVEVYGGAHDHFILNLS